MARFSLTIVADNIRSLENIGSLFRIADAVGADQLYLTGISGYPDMGEADPRRPWLKEKQHKQIAKSALESIDAVPFRYFETCEEVIDTLRCERKQIICVEQDEKSLLYTEEYELKSSVALIFGNEVEGVGKAFLEAADLVLEIPQYGKGKSLNVAVSAGVVCYWIIERFK